MDRIRPVDPALLECLERRLRSDDALPARRGSSGLTREALEALIGPLKMKLPGEAILWWTCAMTRASSLGVLVTRLLDAIDDGTYRYVSEIGDWLDVEQLAAYRRRNPS